MLQYRQGDVLLERIGEFNVRLRKNDNTLLVRGERRHHDHFIEGEVDVFEIIEAGAEVFQTHLLEVHTNAQLIHRDTETGEFTGDHAPITIPSGRYRVIRQREYNPYLETIRQLED
ncbi:MAG: hypothetical protein ACPF9D_01575 [Owenweeksia sp.]